jgi:hypothetical protein
MPDRLVLLKVRDNPVRSRFTDNCERYIVRLAADAFLHCRSSHDGMRQIEIYNLRAMISFIISLVPASIRCTRASAFMRPVGSYHMEPEPPKSCSHPSISLFF